jgi:hypothetical protein
MYHTCQSILTTFFFSDSELPLSAAIEQVRGCLLEQKRFHLHSQVEEDLGRIAQGRESVWTCMTPIGKKLWHPSHQRKHSEHYSEV